MGFWISLRKKINEPCLSALVLILLWYLYPVWQIYEGLSSGVIMHPSKYGAHYSDIGTFGFSLAVLAYGLMIALGLGVGYGVLVKLKRAERRNSKKKSN